MNTPAITLANEATEFDLPVLRDGTSVEFRVACMEDRAALTRFFEQLSPESRQQRFSSVSPPSSEMIDSLCECSDPRSRLTLLAIRTMGGKPQIIATGSYLAKDVKTAEVAFAVDDSMQGTGLGTLLLERLALSAARRGFTRFWAYTHTDNYSMLNVFRTSGFVCEEKLQHGEVEVNLTVTLGENALARQQVRHRVATVASLRPFFRPQSMAVVGASRDPAGIGYRLLDNVVRSGFRGALYPVNPKADEVRGLRAYHSVRDLPGPVDLAVIVVPPAAVLGVVDDCAARGARALLVITAGFAEVGSEGRELQQLLLEKVRGHGMRMIGPNCLGLVCTDPAVCLNATFVPVFPPSGRVAMSSDSGALGLAALAVAGRYGLGISSCVSVGNRADVSSNDLLEYWEEDNDTGVILLYLESFGNPRRFARIARRVSRRKPIIAVKAGRTGAGRRAAGSHTAALAATDVAVDALFKQTGVIRAETLEEMFDLAAALATQPLPAGRRVAIVTNAGGPAILCADACEAAGLSIPELSEATKTQLAAFLPMTASLRNPVDMIASATPESFGRTICTLLDSDEIDALIVICVSAGFFDATGVARVLSECLVSASKASANKPILACPMPDQAGLTIADCGVRKIPCYPFPEGAARVLGKSTAYAEYIAKPPGKTPELGDIDIERIRNVCAAALRQRGKGWLSTEDARIVLQALGLPVAPGGVAKNVDEAAALARSLGFPVALKLASQEIVHKTEMGGVRLNLNNETAVVQAFAEIRDRLAKENKLSAMQGVLVQPMLKGGTEVFVGMTHDPLFGPLMAFGLGGIHVEILGDVCFRVTPLTNLDAQEMVRSIRGYRLLQGYRGHAPADVAALEDVLLRISRLVEEVPQISELDLNPILALPPGEGCRIVDARIEVAIAGEMK